MTNPTYTTHGDLFSRAIADAIQKLNIAACHNLPHDTEIDEMLMEAKAHAHQALVIRGKKVEARDE